MNDGPALTQEGGSLGEEGRRSVGVFPTNRFPRVSAPLSIQDTVGERARSIYEIANPDHWDRTLQASSSIRLSAPLNIPFRPVHR